MRLAHLHLPSYTRYTHASRLQESLIQRHFHYKDSLRSSSPLSPPDPTILTFTTHPTYTVGRRYLSSSETSTYQISPAQRTFLQSNGLAAFHAVSRGGDLTFHGPGQLVAYPIIDLRRHKITPRNYIRLLESTVMRTCSRFSVPDTTTTENPGVWISGGERKICAVGVQVRRGITGHGVALNVTDTVKDYGRGYGMENEGGMLSWGFGRIVACGLEGKSVTWLTREGGRAKIHVQDVAAAFVEDFAKGLSGFDEVCNVNEEDVMLEDLAETDMIMQATRLKTIDSLKI